MMQHFVVAKEQYVHLISKAQQADDVDAKSDASDDQKGDARVFHTLPQFFDLAKARESVDGNGEARGEQKRSVD